VPTVAREPAPATSAEATGPARPCGPRPNPMGEWRTEMWLCQMRASSIGDNSFLATAGQAGAKGDAKGRSVELVHQVIRNWMCEHPDRPVG